jgi:hypothetical protein
VACRGGVGGHRELGWRGLGRACLGGFGGHRELGGGGDWGGPA